MSQKQYHGDPDRDHNFWVYPKDKSLKNTRWDTYNASDLCDNYSSFEKNRFTGVVSIWDGNSQYEQPNNHQAAALPIKKFHGDSSRNHNFWVYPKHKSLKNSRWDVYHAIDLCDDFKLLDKNHLTGIERYECNGHDNILEGTPGYQHPNTYGDAALPIKVFHGDPSREHNFWVYPRHKSLKNSRWDTYNASDLCDNYTLLDKNLYLEMERYKCNGHDNIWLGNP